MKIKIIKKHKSITAPCEFELPNFSVLTGKNGSGKTHLLEAMSNNSKSVIFLNGKLIKNIKYIGYNGLNASIGETCTNQILEQHIKKSWLNYSMAVKDYHQEEPTTKDINRFFALLENADIYRQFVIKVIESTNKEFDKLTEDDFSDFFDIAFFAPNDFFTAQFALIFKDYHRKVEENSLNEFYQYKGKRISRPVLNEQEFIDKFGNPPWDFINRILLETKVPYEVNNPIGTRAISDFTLKLRDIETGFEISSGDLSTGEKVLMSLALAIYNTGSSFGKPDLLLIDEPDAGLHPSMSKMMVDILKQHIVHDNGIPTIISTHSPTTIIASDGVSIYQMIRGNNIPTKISTQQAIEILSSDIPFLKISNDQRRYVFVESKYDVNYYELLTNIYSRIEPLKSEPIYLSARKSQGSNCTDVIDLVTNLSKNGNDQVYGIIDWDNINSSKYTLIVLGENERYAIENYLLDPLLMGLLFLRERKLNFSDFKLSGYSNYSDIGKLTLSDAQTIVDRVLNELGLHSSNMIPYHLQNGWTLGISQEFNLHQGHDLEELYKSKYQFLKSYRREDSLKKDIIEKVINDYPSFSPRQIFDTIMKIK